MSAQAPRLIGIDLGTTNCAVAWLAAGARRAEPHLFEILQLVAPGEISSRPTLPSFLYFPTDAERVAGGTALPWTANPDAIAGVFAREHGALVASRQVSSAKSWLSNRSVDRRARLLPWTADQPPKISPVEASARLLAHLRDAWNHVYAREDESLRLERQAVVLTVPASFDEEARELTVEAARDARFEHLTLLEEPLAALYAWIAAQSYVGSGFSRTEHGSSRPERQLARTLAGGQLVLVCDVGGGTTDFSLIRAQVEEEELRFERIAIGEHLLLGGDNLDLALASLVEGKLTAEAGDARLALTQREALRRHCSAAKERLLSEPELRQVTITVLGAGRGIVGGTRTTSLTRDEVVAALTAFLPTTAPTDLPRTDRRAGLRELGLPYESEPAMTKHLAAFLTRAARTSGPGAPSARSGMARPGAVLFNGGFFAPALARERILDALAAWFGERPRVLDNPRPEAAVAIGAAFYAHLLRHPAASRRLLIRAGSARAYYVAVQIGEPGAGPTAVCVMPRGTEEGTRFVLDREFTVQTNEPVAFTLYSSTQRTDPVNAVVTLTDGDEAYRHAPLVTVLRYGKRSRRVPLAVRLGVVFTEVGTLELWCESRTTEHRWRLQFNLRAAEQDEDEIAEPSDTSGDQVVISDEAIAAAGRLLRQVFGVGFQPDAGDAATGGRVPTRPLGDPDALIGELENALGHGKHAWPLPAIRRLADVLIETVEGRRVSARHEARWLNLTGFCMRPGFGTPRDPWRVGELRKVYVAGLTFPRDVQCQVDWLVLWQRVAAGFTAGQQQELARRLTGMLGLGARKPPHLNPQIVREAWRLFASLERLDGGQRASLGGDLLERIRRDPRNEALVWALGRFGARTPFHGPLNAVVPPAVAERWIDALLATRVLTTEIAAAVAQIGARTGDPARDVGDRHRSATISRIEAAGIPQPITRALREVALPARTDAARTFGESLPEGLRLESD